MKRLASPFDLPGKWYKANLHTHTTTSDGRATPPERVKQYRRAGYDVLALTDHHATNDVSEMSDKSMLVISGMEYHPPCPTSPEGHPYHLVALNVPHGFSFGKRERNHANRCIAKVRRAGGLTFLAHPYWCGMGFEDFKNLKGLAAIEVYNATCDNVGRPCSENEWAYALDHGMALPAVGVDDAHAIDAPDVFKSWTWLRMRSPSVENVLQAVADGASYASTGPKIHDFSVKGGKVRLRCSPAVKIQFVSGPPMGATRRAANGCTIATFSLDVPKKWPFVRAVVIDAAGRKAWSNPIVL